MSFCSFFHPLTFVKRIFWQQPGLDQNGTLRKMLSLQSRQVKKRQIVLDVEWGERTTNQNPRFSKDKHWKLLGGVVMDRLVCMRVCFCIYVCGERARVRGKSVVPPQRNISKIATANQTECKSALWKGLKKKSFEGRRKTGIHFSPFTVPGAQKWVTAL